MRMTIESTEKVLIVNGRESRVWHGRTEAGIECLLFIGLIITRESEQQREFEAELRRPLHLAPSDEAVYAATADLILKGEIAS